MQLLLTIITATTLTQATVIFCLDYCNVLLTGFLFSFGSPTPHKSISTQQSARSCKNRPDYVTSPQTPSPRVKAQVVIIAYNALYDLTCTTSPVTPF